MTFDQLNEKWSYTVCDGVIHWDIVSAWFDNDPRALELWPEFRNDVLTCDPPGGAYIRRIEKQKQSSNA